MSSGTPDRIPAAQRNIALLVAASFFMEILDGTIVTTSAPRIAHSLSVSAGSIGVVITAYVITAATLIPVSGWIAARWGARPTFLSAIAIFTLASLGCALSATLPELIVMRVLQGVGGSMMVPIGRLMVLANAEKRHIMRLTAYLVWPGLAAPVFAPLLGGLITTYANWHWLFLINLPLGAVAFVLGLRIARPSALAPAGALDIVGAVLTCLGLVAAMVTVELLSAHSLNATAIVAAAVPAAFLLSFAVRHLLAATRPLVDLRALRIDTLRAAVSGTAVFSAVIGAGPFLAPLKFQESFGWSPVKSGATVLLIFAGNIGIKPTTTFLYGRFGFRGVIVAATALMSASMVALGLATATTPLVLIGLILLISGIARSVAATGFNTIAFGDVPPAEMRHATTMFTMTQQISSGFGVAGGAVALRLGRPIASVFTAHPASSAPYTVAFLLVAAVALTASLRATRLHPTAGDVLRTRAREAAPPDPTQAEPSVP